MAKLNLGAAAAAVLMITSSPAFAEMANGTYNHDFTGEVQLWDISGSYSDPDEDFTIVVDPSGAFTGTGTLHTTTHTVQGDIVLNGPMNIVGKTTGKATAPKVSFKVFVVNGTGTVYGRDITFTATENINANLDTVNRQLVITSGNAQVKLVDILTGRKGSGSQKITAGETTDLPADSDGDWNLTLNLTPFDTKKYDGTASTASVGTSTGGTADLTATGTYTSRTDTSKITLKRTGGSNLNLLISTTGPSLAVKSAKGKLYGQTVNFIAP